MANIYKFTATLIFLATATFASEPTTQPTSHPKKLAFHYEMPKNDRARKHPDWDDKITFQMNIVGAVPNSKSEWENGLAIFKVEVPKQKRELYSDINCFRNSGGISISKSEGDWLKEAKNNGYAIGTYWFDFDSRQQCQRFTDYLRRNSELVTTEDPIILTVDDNHFYRIIRIEHFVTIKDEKK